jgi:hypothetical protein
VIARWCRDGQLLAERFERRDQNAAATISVGCPHRRDPSNGGADCRRRCDTFGRAVIAAYLVGDAEALARLHAIPDAVNSGLARAIAKLGIDLQRTVQEDELSGQTIAARSGSLRSSIDLRIGQSAARVTATIFSDSVYARAHEYGFAGTVDVRASLRRIRVAFGRPISEKTVNVQAHRRRMDLPERSFLRSALEEITPAIRDEVELALREAVT